MSEQPWTGRRLHLVGIGGAGMSGLALIAKQLGAEVTGSDRAISPYWRLLQGAGIDPTIGHSAANVPAGAQVVYSSAVAPDNPELGACAKPLHRSALLAEIAGLKRCIAVSGTHGKTTTAGMIAHVLSACGLEPAYVIGAELRDTGRNAGWGSGEWIVLEADESDRSLLRYRPEIAIITNAELDHHATYGSRLELEATLVEFASGARTAVVWDRPVLRRIAAAAAETLTYDAREPRAEPSGITFVWRGQPVKLALPGLHNAVNAAGALTVAALAGAPPEAAVKAIGSFHGARRRLELLGRTAAGAPVYDDYAHHPTEVAATIAAAREFGATRLVAVFQPHLYSRTRALARDFGRALAAADLVAVLDVYAARESPSDFPGVSGHLVAAAAADAGVPVAWMPALDDARAWLTAQLSPGDLCLLMGAGNIDSLGRALVGASAESKRQPAS